MKKIIFALLLLSASQAWAQDKDQDHTEVLVVKKTPMDRGLRMNLQNRQISARQRMHRANFISRWANKLERKANKWSTKLEMKLNKAFHKTDIKTRKVSRNLVRQ